MPHVAALLPQNQAKMSKSAFLYVRMSMMQKEAKKGYSTRENAFLEGARPE